MPVIGITGGVASGKTSFTRLLSLRLTAKTAGTVTVFDADAAARRLVENDPDAKRRIAARFGSQVVGEGSQIDRARLREIVFADPAQRQALEEILHPLIRAEWTALAVDIRGTGDWLLADIPLLFETGSETECDLVVVVACDPATQIARIVSQRGLSEEMARKIIATQTSLASKVVRADDVLWNDAPPERLEEQTEIFAGYLVKRYG